MHHWLCDKRRQLLLKAGHCITEAESGKRSLSPPSSWDPDHTCMLRFIPQVTSDFLNLSTTDIWVREFFIVGNCPMHCRILLASLVSTHWMPVPYPLGVTTQNVSRHCQISLGQGCEARSALIETCCFISIIRSQLPDEGLVSDTRQSLTKPV